MVDRVKVDENETKYMPINTRTMATDVVFPQNRRISCKMGIQNLYLGLTSSHGLRLAEHEAITIKVAASTRYRNVRLRLRGSPQPFESSCSCPPTEEVAQLFRIRRAPLKYPSSELYSTDGDIQCVVISSALIGEVISSGGTLC